LRGLAQKFAAPKEQGDPRFFERRNLYTFLRDVGQYGAEQKEGQKVLAQARAEQQQKLDDLIKKYKYEGAKESEEAAFKAMKEFGKPAKARSLVADAQRILDLELIINDPASSEPAKKAAKRQLTALTESKSPEDNSKTGQYMRALKMSRSKDPQERADGLKLMRYLEGSGRSGQLTLPQKRSDEEILAARNRIKGVPQAKIDMAFQNPYKNSRDSDLVRDWKLSQRKTLAEMIDEGVVAPAVSDLQDEDVIDEEMP